MLLLYAECTSRARHIRATLFIVVGTSGRPFTGDAASQRVSRPRIHRRHFSPELRPIRVASISREFRIFGGGGLPLTSRHEGRRTTGTHPTSRPFAFTIQHTFPARSSVRVKRERTARRRFHRSPRRDKPRPPTPRRVPFTEISTSDRNGSAIAPLSPRQRRKKHTRLSNRIHEMLATYFISYLSRFRNARRSQTMITLFLLGLCNALLR